MRFFRAKGTSPLSLFSTPSIINSTFVPCPFKNNMLPSGEVNRMGESLVISVVSRHHTGLYICTADNGVGHPSHANIDLQVLCE